MIGFAVVFAALLGAFVFGALPRLGPARRLLSVGLFGVLVAIVYGGGVDLLGRPKPLRLEWRDASAAQVLSAVPVEGEGIYLWLSLPEAPEPRAYVLPWSLQAAQQLQAAMSQAQNDGTAVQMVAPFEPGLDERAPKFYAEPQPALPAKEYVDAAPVIFEPPETPY
jgi:hypothetical protein